MLDPWPHQTSGVDSTLAAIDAGQRRIILCAATGAGKTLMMMLLAKHYLQRGKRVIIYTNRTMLLEQLSRQFEDAGVFHGVRSAGWDEDLDLPLQLSSIPTEHSRVTRRKKWDVHPADLVLVDECHSQTGDSAQTILTKHYEQGAAIVGVTATPVGLNAYYDTLIVAAKVSDARGCGSLVPARYIGVDEPDFKALKRAKKQVPEEGEVTETQARHAIMTPTIFGRVIEHFNTLNPEHKPSILFAPGVPDSYWFAQQFEQAGIKAAHIDGQDVYVDGELHKSSSEIRQEVMKRSESGDIKIICNRYVLREGIDAPWLEHGIFATIFGSLQAYIQSGGRLLRQYFVKGKPTLERVTIQDHGGNWWRWGSLNADLNWNLEYTGAMLAGVRVQNYRDRKEKEPFLCPNCKMVWAGNYTTCVRALGGCGYELQKMPKKTRTVVQVDGSLRELGGDIFRPRTPYTEANGPALWERFYHAAKSKKTVMVDGKPTEKGWEATFNQAMAYFAQKNNWQWPDRSWPLMPTDPYDFYRLVKDVPRERLIPKESPDSPQGDLFDGSN